MSASDGLSGLDMILAFLPMIVLWAAALALPIILFVLIVRWVRAAERSAQAQERIAGALERIAHTQSPQEPGPLWAARAGGLPEHGVAAR